MAKIEFIGLGNMGLPMAQNLLKAGHGVQGFDVSKAQVEALAASGGQTAGSVKAAASGVDIVITMLPAGQHVREFISAPTACCRRRRGDAADQFLHHRRRDRARSGRGRRQEGLRCSTRRCPVASAARRPAR